MTLDSWALDAQVGVRSRAWYERAFPPIDAPTRWHVSPIVDLVGYGFSWMILAVPIYLMLGSESLQPRDYRTEGMVFLAAGVLLFDVHRHFTFPYVFLDPSVRRRFPLRIFLLPALLLGLLTQLPSLSYRWTPVSVPGAAAVVAWVMLLFQTLRHDGMGPTHRRRALALTGGAVGLALAVCLFSQTAPYSDWAMLLLPVGASLMLSATLFRSLEGGTQTFADVHPARSRSGLLPAAVLALVAGSAVAPSAFAGVTIPVAVLVNGIFVAYIGWLLHHGMSQKYGILRLYSAKSGQEAKVPGWVDRWIAWSWVPMMIVWAAASSPETVRSYLDNQSSGASVFVSPLIDFIGRRPSTTFLVAIAPIVGAIATFLYFEWKLHHLRNMPRLGYVGGSTLLYASMFPLGPAGLYIAFAASHSFEYMTFIWAFQRRRYGTPRGTAPILEHLTQHPLLYFGTASAILLAVFIVGRFVLVHGVQEVPYAFGYPIPYWIFWYSILQAIIHFYYDGFLWKLRRPELARSI
jgi:hypothetical protein